MSEKLIQKVPPQKNRQIFFPGNRFFSSLGEPGPPKRIFFNYNFFIKKFIIIFSPGSPGVPGGEKTMKKRCEGAGAPEPLSYPGGPRGPKG